MTARVSEPVLGVEGTRLVEAIDNGENPIPGPRVALVGAIHGNEPVGVGVIERFLTAASAELTRGSVLLVHANLQSWRARRRHSEDGVDLNRLWDRQTLASLAAMPIESLCYEERRALELAPLLLSCDAVLDLHSTSRPSPPFLVFRDDQRHAALARQLGVRNLVTGIHESLVLPGGVCSNVGLDPAEVSERVGFTFEAGQHDDAGNRERAWWVAVRLLALLGMWRTEPPALGADARVEVYEVLDRFSQAPAGARPWQFVPPAEASLRRDQPRALESFEWVHADERLVQRGSAVVRAQAPFTMLMPAPDAGPGADLFFFAQRRHGGLSVGEHRSDNDAHREAVAIERMMDLLADDEMEDGASWVSFDNRRCLDLCADLIGRTLRMAPSDPHRRITIVGRGDWGGDESERRSGQRYRQMLRRALRDGVPVERLQVMRGASLGWLDALTSRGMLELLAAPQRGEARLLLSVQQPHTVSLLVVGDLEHALATGDLRHVRVAVLIEAATVEADEDTAHVRVVRTGVISARAEILRAARNVIGAIRSEHAHLATTTQLLCDPVLGPLIGPDGRALGSPDREHLVALRRIVLGLQLRLWAEALRPEIPSVLHLASGRALGRWLASVMSRSGILDVDALRRLLVQPHGGGWVVDPGRLERLAAGADLRGIEDGLLAPHPRPSPVAPVVASDVTGDNLERWIGWKRWLRGLDLIPAERGKDLDLAFDEGAIRARLTRWLVEARERAAEAPGDVLVVMAGDGMNPNREADASALLTAHRAVLLDPNVRYLRIQHAQGTHLAWMRDLIDTLASRPDGGEPVALLFEAEHGATVNVILVCERDPHASGPAEPWTLEGWTIRACAAVVSDPQNVSAQDTKLALFTDRAGEVGPINEELLYFGRAHCEGLLKQVGWRAAGVRGAPEAGAIERVFCQHLERWVEQVRSLGVEGVLQAPREEDGRVEWVARQLGIADRDLARALAAEIAADGPAPVAARRVWASARPWS